MEEGSWIKGWITYFLAKYICLFWLEWLDLARRARGSSSSWAEPVYFRVELSWAKIEPEHFILLDSIRVESSQLEGSNHLYLQEQQNNSKIAQGKTKANWKVFS